MVEAVAVLVGQRTEAGGWAILDDGRGQSGMVAATAAGASGEGPHTGGWTRQWWCEAVEGVVCWWCGLPTSAVGEAVCSDGRDRGWSVAVR